MNYITVSTIKKVLHNETNYSGLLMICHKKIKLSTLSNGKRIITLGNKTSKLSTKFLLVLLLMLSGDVECHPGPSTLETLIQSSGIKLFH